MSRVFDKGRFAGGRIATRTTPVGDFDHGAQFVRLHAQPDDSAGLRLASASTLQAWDFHGRAVDAWIGVPQMRQLPATWANGLSIASSVTVTRLARRADGWWLTLHEPAGATSTAGPYDAVMLTVPVPQLTALLPAVAPPPPPVTYAPCLTLMAACLPGCPASIDLDGSADGPVAWLATEHDKPGRGGAARITVQAGPQWSEAHFEVPAEAVQEQMVRALAACGWPVEPVAYHRWRYARVVQAAPGPQWHGALGLGYAGDGFSGPRVGAAWHSGVVLAHRYLAWCRG